MPSASTLSEMSCKLYRNALATTSAVSLPRKDTTGPEYPAGTSFRIADLKDLSLEYSARRKFSNDDWATASSSPESRSGFSRRNCANSRENARGATARAQADALEA